MDPSVRWLVKGMIAMNLVACLLERFPGTGAFIDHSSNDIQHLQSNLHSCRVNYLSLIRPSSHLHTVTHPSPQTCPVNEELKNKQPTSISNHSSPIAHITTPPPSPELFTSHLPMSFHAHSLSLSLNYQVHPPSALDRSSTLCLCHPFPPIFPFPILPLLSLGDR